MQFTKMQRSKAKCSKIFHLTTTLRIAVLSNIRNTSIPIEIFRQESENGAVELENGQHLDNHICALPLFAEAL